MAIKTKITESEDPDSNFWFWTVLDTSVCDPRTNANLTIELYINLHQINPTSFEIPFINRQLKLDKINDSDNVAHTIKAWTPSLWKKWTATYVKSAHRFWSGKLWLTPPDSFADLDFTTTGIKYRPNIYCQLKIILVEGTTGFHKKIDVVRLKDAREEFRSDAGLYSDNDIKTSAYPFVKDDKGKYHTYYQQATTHEVGHAMGMLHSAHLLPPVSWAEGKSFMACIGTDDGINGNPCYGTGYRTEVGGNIMGYGRKLAKANAYPWRHRIGLHTGTNQNDWGVELNHHVYPKKVP